MFDLAPALIFRFNTPPIEIGDNALRSCPTTRAYVAKRTTKGKTPREIRRCLKRYIARQLYRTLTTTMTT